MVVVQPTDDHRPHDHCSHDHHHHYDDESPSDDLVGNDCDHHQHDDGQPGGCDEGDCSFPSARRNNDLELMLTLSMGCQALGVSAHAVAGNGLLSLHSATEAPDDPLAISCSVRAKTQVWRL